MTALALIADKGYDSDEIVAALESKGKMAVIPCRRNRKKGREFSKLLYRERNRVERFFCRLKQCRGLATRYEKTATSYMAMVHLVCAKMWLL